MQLVQLHEKLIITSSLDECIAIWSLNGDCRGRHNVNHPLPLKWNIRPDYKREIS